MAGTRFDFSYLPRVISAVGYVGQTLGVRVWRTFKFTSPSEVCQRLSSVLRIEDEALLRQLGATLQGRSRFWVKFVYHAYKNPGLSVAELYNQVSEILLEDLSRELGLLVDTDPAFPGELAGYYLGLVRCGLDEPVLAPEPPVLEHGGVFFYPFTEKRFVELQRDDLLGRRIPLDGARQQIVEPLMLLALEQKVLDYPEQLLAAYCKVIYQSPTSQAAASALDFLLALLLLYRSVSPPAGRKRWPVNELLLALDPDLPPARLPTWAASTYLPELRTIHRKIPLLEYLVAKKPEVSSSAYPTIRW